MFFYFLDPCTLYHDHYAEKERKRTKMNSYRIYGDDNDDYAFGGPLFDKQYLRTVKASSPQKAIRKFYNISKKKHLGWRLYDLSARKTRTR